MSLKSHLTACDIVPQTKSPTINLRFTIQLLELTLCILFSKYFFFRKISFRNTIRVSNSLDPFQAGPDLGPNCLQSLSVDDTSKQRAKVGVVFGKGTCLTSNMTLSHICQYFYVLKIVPAFYVCWIYSSALQTSEPRPEVIKLFSCWARNFNCS